MLTRIPGTLLGLDRTGCLAGSGAAGCDHPVSEVCQSLLQNPTGSAVRGSSGRSLKSAGWWWAALILPLQGLAPVLGVCVQGALW